jgi:hypothetical protein
MPKKPAPRKSAALVSLSEGALKAIRGGGDLVLDSGGEEGKKYPDVTLKRG